jgi:CubicO group peptidase (beta-lactamase class C family)
MSLTSRTWVAMVSLVIATTSNAQVCPEEIRGGWESELAASLALRMTIVVQLNDEDGYSARLETANGVEHLTVLEDGRGLQLRSVRSPLKFDGRPGVNGETIDGFIEYASNLYRITLAADKANSWAASWSPLPVEADTVKLDLYFGDDGSGGTGGYFFFRDERLPGLFGLGARCEGRRVRVAEKNLGLAFDGEFNSDYSELEMSVTGPGGTSNMTFRPLHPERQALRPGTSDRPPRLSSEQRFADRAPARVDDGWSTAKPSDAEADVGLLAEMVSSIEGGEFPSTHSILVAKSGELVVEEYFYGFNRDTLHDMRSASKSITSTLIGIAVDRGIIESSDMKVLPLFPEYESIQSWHATKAEIRIRDLLTMSSGLDANDSDRNSVASEMAYQSQTAQPDWTKLALDAPMVAEPGTRLIYGGANPLILGGILDNVVDEPVYWFAETYLFNPLGIDSYRIYLDPEGVPYMGGGMHLRPRDMLKYAQMYLDGGRWQGRQILSESWIKETFAKYGRLEPLDRNGNYYGYLWWHEEYEVNDETIASIEARGNGGQYIFIVPELDMVAVITAGNYRGGLAMTRQPQTIFEQYVLPAIVQF